MTIYIEDLYNNPNAVVTLYTPLFAQTNYGIPKSIVGLIESDFGFGMGSRYSDSDAGSEALDSAATVASGLAGGPNIIVKTLQQTLSYWNGASKPKFSIPMTLIKYTQNMTQASDPISILKIVLGGVAPIYSGATMIAPYNYSTPSLTTTSISAISQIALSLNKVSNTLGLTNTSADVLAAKNAVANEAITAGIQNTWTIQYGQWFMANFLLLESVSFLGSKQNIKNIGDPMIIKIGLNFTTAITPSRDMIMGWFISNSAYNTASPTTINNIAPTGDTTSTPYGTTQ